MSFAVRWLPEDDRQEDTGTMQGKNLILGDREMLKFPPDFFKDETRCDFFVPSMMKKAWATQMEILQIVADICEENGLQYFADGGVLLGAVRHQGFIPWDDDIDIALKREEYNELVRILPEKLPKGFKMEGMYMQPVGLEDAFPGFHSNVGTDGDVWRLKEHMDRFYGFPYPGIGVDIFCYDYLPRDREAEELQSLILSYGRALFFQWDAVKESGELEERLQKIEELCGVTLPRQGNIRWNLQQLLDSVASLYQDEESDAMTIALSLSRVRRGADFHVRKECLEKVVYMPFEHMEIAVPCGWHEVLVGEYGENYMKFEKGTAGHEYPCYATEERKMMNVIRGLGLEYTVDEFLRKVADGEIYVDYA